MTGESDRPRLAILSWSSALYDSRTDRLARSAVAAGYEVVVYARRDPGTDPVSERGDYRVVRVPAAWRAGLPPPWRGRSALGGPASGGPAAPRVSRDGDAVVGTPPRGRTWSVLRAAARLPLLSGVARMIRLALIFPLRPMGWAVAVESVADPADVWHGMWAGSLPALDRLRRRHGGGTVYDARDVFLLSRDWARLPAPLVAPFRWLEKRWAGRTDAVITVNRAYARLLRETMGLTVRAIVRNCPNPYESGPSRPNRIREALDLQPSVPIALYQGQLVADRGIEQTIEAMDEVPGAVLVLLGFGRGRDHYAALAHHRTDGRVRVLDAVPPEDLLEWTASADVMLMPIQPTSPNHRFTTPNKLWEALAAGVPVVASDLPGMAEVVSETGSGVLCDPTSPSSIAAAIRSVLDLGPAERAQLRDRAVAAARGRYNWDAQVAPLLALYAVLRRGDPPPLPDDEPVPPPSAPKRA